MTYNIKQSKQTTDGYYIYDLTEVPQEGNYIKINNMFARSETQVYKQVNRILGHKDFELNIIKV